MIPYGRQDIRQQDLDAVIEVLKSDFITQGPVVPQFEAALAEKSGAAHAVAMNSATSALHVAVVALGLGQGDLMWTTPITFVASANCGRYVGADVDFVDIDPETFNMCPRALATKLAQAEAAGRLPKVIVPVHMCGQSAAMCEIAELVRPYGIRIVEDASHAVGGRYRDQPVGSCQYSDITIFSFHPVKIITTAEGGMALTNDVELAARMELLRSHGITRDPTRMTQDSDGPWYYQQVELGWNYRMTEIQAALGLSQQLRLADYVEARNALANRYDRLLADLPLDLPGRLEATRSAFHLYVIRLHDASRRREVFETLRANGIGVNLHYIPVHLQPYYRDLGFAEGDFPAAEDYYSRAISIPLFAQLSEVEQDEVVARILEALQ
ncbi:UDP-4-amino-4,6-dideoxy-N-acetyl-beta-L-altrosamine transaminase [Pseudophaeobacter arcticus]|jgi:UDP-4-amino-4,6-dideoxy-N-acetyl-beta-L-altrosamine transaminase|uniref:UDP-4-amino-4, 6-dideoxy-N-acetyl-beta-L-altrosamine transaminase n=1 Tax=Pseudophaeobacter arcticus TaxID=385492 RepID=UPI00248F858D|nr:UDP-4-amino-4,6-dideoxy-N-acetyl-beta-L-altrosamine transaminase [Pseudophaeobacter arcticus]